MNRLVLVGAGHAHAQVVLDWESYSFDTEAENVEAKDAGFRAGAQLSLPLSMLIGLSPHAFAGARVTAVGSAAEAIAELKRWLPDVLVSDIGMPHEDGYSLMRKVRAMLADQPSLLPAIALTAYARSEDRTRAMLAGFQSHVAKPVEVDELLIVVATLAGRTSSEWPE